MAGNQRHGWVCLRHGGGHTHPPLPRIAGGRAPAPWHRTLLVSKIDEVVEYDGQSYALGANRWAGGAIDPAGYLHIERFRLEGTTAGVDLRLRGRADRKAHLDGARREHNLRAIHRVRASRP